MAWELLAGRRVPQRPQASPATRIRDPLSTWARPVPRGFTTPPDSGPCFPTAGPAHSDSDGYALNVPPMLSSDQLLLVPLGHPRSRRQASPRAGPSRLRLVNRPWLLRHRTRDHAPAGRPSSLRLGRTRTQIAPPTLSSDQLLIVQPGHAPAAGDRPPHVGALSTSGGYKASPCGALPASGLGLDWFPSISRDMGRPRTQGCQERTIIRPPPQGPDSD